jgi:flagellar M-ring protein FliF
MKEGFSAMTSRLMAAWQQLGFNQRVSLVLASGAVLVGLVALIILSSRTSWAPLHYGRIDEAEAAKVVAALEEAKISYQIRGAGSVYVPTDKVYSVRMQLAAKGIPRTEQVGFDLFEKPSFGLSDFVQNVNYRRALQGELARTISQLDAVESARVLVVRPDTRLVITSGSKTTASVFVQVRGHHRLPMSTVSAIQLLVANSVEGLTAANVSVVDNLGNTLTSDQEENSVGGLSSSQLRALREREQYLQSKAEEMLQQVLGPGQAVVRVAVDINWNTRTTYEEEFDPEGQVLRISTANDEEVQSVTAPGGGAAGIAANAPPEGAEGALADSARPLTTTKNVTRRTDNQYEVNRKVSSHIDQAGSIERLTAAVVIAPRYEGTGADRRPVPRGTNELANFQRLVQHAIGIREGDPNRNDELTLIEQEFDKQTLFELSRELERQNTQQYWTELALRLVYPALGLMVLMLFWRALRRLPESEIPLGLPLGGLELEGAGHGHGNGNGSDHARPYAAAQGIEPKVVTVDVLNQLIRENPANMTQAVRTWLTHGKTTR